jgi:hypothetical protein
MTLLIIIITAVVLRIGWQVRRSRQVNSASPSKPKKPISPWQKQLFTVGVFFVINLKRITRDRTALFFTFLFPLIFLFVFGSLSHSNSTTFNLAIINHSGSAFSKQFVSQINHQKIFKVNNTVTSINRRVGRYHRVTG